ncbi:MAG: DUF167 domain-containing protein [Amoebophilaceae bacterium]|nr:DUF167 domain-containing protein [Amoebophilaceae bacterium]
MASFLADTWPAFYFLYVHAKPKSRQNKIENWIVEPEKSTLQVRIMALPENGKANEAILVLLATTLGIPKSNIKLIRGATARHKVFKIEPWSYAWAQKLPPYKPLPTLF